MTRHITAETPLNLLADEHDGFSLMTYNVLLPNSGDGWWIFKYYDAAVPDAQRAWSHRQRLLRDRILTAHADIVCLQETSAETFNSDFGFMGEGGYDHVLHKKFRLRNATFWRADRWELVVDKHKNKTLLTLLRHRQHENRLLCVVNCHLTAAPAPEQRLRQVFEPLDQIRKELNKLKRTPEGVAVIVCGDFNCAAPGSATDHLLRHGSVGPELREPGWPDLQLTSKRKGHIFGPFADAYLCANGEPTQTLVVSRPGPHFLDPDSRQPTLFFTDAIRRIFALFAGNGDVMDLNAVEVWIHRINRAPERGSEYRKALAIFEEKCEQTLTFEEFLALYVSELRDGKYWSIQHDMQVCGVAPDDGARRIFEAPLDRIYFNTNALDAVATRDPLTVEQRQRLYHDKEGLPNAWHPSDHLPQEGIFAWKAQTTSTDA